MFTYFFYKYLFHEIHFSNKVYKYTVHSHLVVILHFTNENLTGDPYEASTIQRQKKHRRRVKV